MTTIVVTDNMVYADGQSTAGRITDYDVKKIVNLGGAIVAGAGRYSHVVKFHKWVEDTLLAAQAKEDYPHVNISMPENMVDEDFLGVVLYGDGTCVQFEGCADYYEVSQPVTIGSGADYAAGALAVGADGYSAVEAAIQLDPFSGGTIQVEGFEEEQDPLTLEEAKGKTKEELITFLFGEDSNSCCAGDVETEPDINVLKNTADYLELSYPHNIGIETLRNKILAHLNK